MSLEVVDKTTLRDLMLRNKDFLARLYIAESVPIARKLIVNAESEQLCLLIQVLHYTIDITVSNIVMVRTWLFPDLVFVQMHIRKL